MTLTELKTYRTTLETAIQSLSSDTQCVSVTQGSMTIQFTSISSLRKELNNVNAEIRGRQGLNRRRASFNRGFGS